MRQRSMARFHDTNATIMLFLCCFIDRITLENKLAKLYMCPLFYIVDDC